MAHIEWQVQGYALYVIGFDARQIAAMTLEEAKVAGSSKLVIGWEITVQRATRLYRPVTVHGAALDPNEHVLAYGISPGDARTSWESTVQGRDLGRATS